MNTEHLEDKMIAALEGELNSTEYNTLMDSIEKNEELSEVWKSYECIYGVLNDIEMEPAVQNSKSRFTEFLEKEVKNSQQESSTQTAKVVSFKHWRKLSAIAAASIGVLFIWNMNQHVKLDKNPLNQTNGTFAEMLHNSSSTEKIKAIRVNYAHSDKEIDNEMIKLLFEVLHRDESSNVRLAAVESLRHHSERSDVRAALIKSLDSESDGFVKLAIIKSLSNRFNSEIENKFEGIINDDTNEKFIIDEVQKELFRHTSIEI